MSVRLFPSRDNEAPAVRGLRVLGAALKIVEAFAKIAAGVSAVGLACLLVEAFGPSSAASKIVFAQWVIGWALTAFFLGNLRLLVADFGKQGTGGAFGRSQGKRLRRMALAILALFLAGLGFSFAAGWISEGGFPALNVGAPLFGFPTQDDWAYVLEGVYYPPNLRLVTVDVSALLFSGALWTLSYAFDYGAWLQEENESVA